MLRMMVVRKAYYSAHVVMLCLRNCRTSIVMCTCIFVLFSCAYNHSRKNLSKTFSILLETQHSYTCSILLVDRSATTFILYSMYVLKNVSSLSLVMFHGSICKGALRKLQDIFNETAFFRDYEITEILMVSVSRHKLFAFPHVYSLCSFNSCECVHRTV